MRVVLPLLAIGAVLVLVAGSWTWTVGSEPLLVDSGPVREVRITGGDVAPLATAAAWASLGGVLVLIAVRGRARVVVGIIIAAAGIAVVGAAIAAGVVVPGAVVAIIGGALIAVAGVATARWGPSWPSLGRRYESPSAQAELSAWDALDAGHDPTDSA